MSEHLCGSKSGTAVMDAVATRVLIVDDHPLVRQAVRETLAQAPELSVCGEAADEAAARELVMRLHPDLVLLDLSLGDTTAIRTVLSGSIYLNPTIVDRILQRLADRRLAPHAAGAS